MKDSRLIIRSPDWQTTKGVKSDGRPKLRWRDHGGAGSKTDKDSKGQIEEVGCSRGLLPVVEKEQKENFPHVEKGQDFLETVLDTRHALYKKKKEEEEKKKCL